MRRRSFWIWLGVAILAFGALAYFLATRFPEAIDDPNGRLTLAQSVLWAALIGAGAIVHIRQKPILALKSIGAWLLIAGVLLAGYTYRHDFRRAGERILGELMPSRGTQSAKSITFAAERNGHFIVDAEVDGTRVRFLVDTGASDVVLSPADAKRLGFDPKALSFDRRFNTANGTVMGAPVRLKRVSIGPIAVDDVRASVNGAPMAQSLLGMSFLERLSSWNVKEGRLTLVR